MPQFRRFSTIFLTAMLFFFVSSPSSKEETEKYLNDSVLTTKVKAAIYNEPTLKATEINIETLKGEVQLSGFVSSPATIDRVIEIARGVRGVKSVKNKIQVK